LWRAALMRERKPLVRTRAGAERTEDGGGGDAVAICCLM